MEVSKETSDEKGHIQWTGLSIQKEYRIIEVAAPNGYSLLKGEVFRGKISMDKLEMTISVVNRRGFSLPDTGSATMRNLQILSSLSICLLFAINLYSLKKKGSFNE